MKSSKNAHHPVHRRTDKPKLGTNTIKRWNKLHRQMETVTDQPVTKPKPILSTDSENNKPTLADIWPIEND